mgnify:CR=1 FL=1
MKIKFARPAPPTSGVLVLLAGEGGKLGPFATEIDRATDGQIARAMKAAGFEGKREKVLDIVAPAGLKLDRIVVVGAGKPGELAAADLEMIGGAAMGAVASGTAKDAAIAVDIDTGDTVKAEEAAALIASGALLRSYSFDKYKSKATREKGAKKAPPKSLTVMTAATVAAARKAFAPLEAIGGGVALARDLVNEPANVLDPVAFAKQAKALEKLGVEVEILEPKQLEKLGMRALLAVGQGSANESRVAVMMWNGGKKKDKPVAFIGKGVTFDTGGISIKPAGGMQDMKGDMGGAACVTGLMHALAARKAKVNAVGVIGLVENMPDGNAQRPGDIVTSMSGQTIEIQNTDAEGRLVLADILWYAQDRFKPQFMVNLATLTGAILVALGKEHAGLFSNNDALADRLFASGAATREKVWRMPLGPEYDKLIDSDFADMKNIGGRNAGSITAGQFLQRFVNDTPWAHLDVAGTAMDSPKTAISQSWASGWGVRLLNHLVAEHYEK